MTIAVESFYKTRNAKLHRRPRFALRPIAWCVMLACEAAWANPTGPQVVNGTVSFARPDARTLNITNTPGSIINWQGFSIGASEITRFTQQSSLSAVLNRVVGPDISQLQGQLLSNGRVYLINPAGILVGAGAVIDTAGFVGSTVRMLDADFLAGKLKFDGAGTGVLRNEGTIKASGDIYLVGPTIENAGVIRSKGGNVVLAAGKSVTIASPDIEGVQFKVQAPTDSAVNLGTIDAKNAAGMFAGTLRHSGDIRAAGMGTDSSGRIVLYAQKDATVDSGATLVASGAQGGRITVQSGGTTLVAGSLDATGAAGKGGTVHLLGELVGVTDSAVVNASGTTGGGTILVGGDYQGRNTAVPNAQATYFGPDAALKADAISAGDGGKVIVWSDGPTRAYGAISARGGAQSGNGGFVETSGHYLDVTRGADVSAPAGRGGLWLLDPGEVRVTQGGADNNIVVGTTFQPVDPNTPSRLTTATLNPTLTNNATVVITTGGAAGSGSGDIIFDASPAMGGAITVDKNAVAPGSTLRLNAWRDIRFIGGTTTFRTTAAQTLDVEFNPGQGGIGGVFTNNGATTAFLTTGSPTPGPITARIINGRVWQNDGTISLQPNTSIELYDGTTVATLNNNGLITANVAGNTAFASDPATRSGVLNNGGTLNVTSSGQFDVQLNNTGNVAISGGSMLSATNAGTIGGTVDIGAGSTLRLNDSSVTGGIFDGTSITGPGTVLLMGDFGITPRATFRGVSATNATLNVGQNSTAILDNAPSTFFSITVAPSPGGGVNAGVLTGNTAVTITDQLTTAGDSTFNFGTVVGSTVNVTNGTLTVSGTGTLSGPGGAPVPTLNWTGGTISGTGGKAFTDIASNGTVTFDGNLLLISGVWDSLGTVNQTGAAVLTVTQDARVDNHLAWNLSSTDANPIRHGGANVSTFNNLGGGTFTNVANDHTLTVSNFVNNGTVTITAGNLSLPPGDGAPEAGFINVAAGRTLVLDGNRSMTGQINGAGNVTFASGIFNSTNEINAAGAFNVTGGTANFAPGNNINPASVTVSGGTANFGIAGLALNGPLTISGNGTANFNQPTTVAGNFTLSGGTLGGTSTLDLNGATNQWTSGSMTGAGTTTFANALAITTLGLKTFRQRTLTTNGLVTWDGGQIDGGDGGTFTNNAGFTIQADANWTNAFAIAPTVLDNQSGITRSSPGPGLGFGTAGLDAVRIIGGNGILALSGTLRLGAGLAAGDVNTHGAITINTAAVDFAGGIHNVNGDVTGGGALIVSGGTFNLNPLAQLTTTGALTVSGGTGNFNPTNATMTPSSVTISGGGIANFDKALTTPGALTMSGGTLGGAGAVTVNGAGSVWSGGTMNGTGALNTPNGLSITNPVTFDGRTWNNTSTVSETGAGRLTLLNNAIIHNQNGATWNVDTTDSIAITGPGTFNNAGTFRKDGTTEQTVSPTTFNNTNLVDVIGPPAGGGLFINATGTHSGDFGILVNHFLDFSGGAATFAAGSTISGGGGVRFTGGTHSGPVAISNLGAFGVLGGSLTVDATGRFANIGDSFVTGGGTLNMNGAAVPASTGSLLVAGAGTSANFGTPLTIDGTLNVIAGATLFGAATTVGGNFTMTGGTVTSNGTLTLNGLNNTWTAGTITGGGLLVTPAPTGTTVDGTVILENKRWDSFGTVTMSGSARLVFEGNGGTPVTFTNKLGGTVIDTSTNDTPLAFSTTQLNKTFVNEGTFTKDVGSFGTQMINVAVNNSKTMNVSDGTLQLIAGGTHTGAFAVSGGAVLEFGGGVHALGAGSSITGTGTVRISAGELDVNTPMTIANPVVLTGGGNVTLGGTADVTLTGPFTWNQGADIRGSGLLTTTGTTTMSNAQDGVDKNWTNTGTVNMDSTAGIDFFVGASTITNNGTFNVASTQPTPFSLFSGSGAFVNNNTFNKTGAGTQTIQNVTFTNGTNGNLNVSNGIFVIPSLSANPGTITLSNNATLSTNGGALSNTGTIGGVGTINLGTNTLSNNGTLRPGLEHGDTTDRLAITGNLTQGPNGQVNIELGGTAPGDFDVLAISNTANLAGTMNVSTTNGYAPVNGNSFTVLTAGTRNGLFAAVNQNFGGALTAAYDATSLMFTIGGAGTDTWLADTDNWNVPGNWSLGHVPGPGEAAIINRPGGPFNVILPAGTYSPDSLTSQENIALQAGATLNLASASTINNAQLAINGGTLGGAGPLTVNGSLNFNGGQILNSGGVTVTGTSNLAAGAMQLNGPLTTALLNMSGGTLNIGAAGILTASGAGVSVVDSATLTNGGTLGVTGGGTLAVHANATFTNPGTINIQNGTMQVNGGFGTNPGTIMIGPGSMFSTNGNPLTNTGLIGGNGTLNLNGQTVTNNGTFAPGASPGTLTVNGNYTQGPNGTLAIELQGTQQGVTYDLMQVTGVADLNGTLSVTPINGYVPRAGDTFTFMTYNSRVGDFTTFTAPGGLLSAPGATAYAVQLPNAGTGAGHIAQDETQRLNDQLITVLGNQQMEEPPARTGQMCP